MSACLPACFFFFFFARVRSSLLGTLMWFSIGGMKAATVLLDTSDPSFFPSLQCDLTTASSPNAGLRLKFMINLCGVVPAKRRR